jgi:hypothetical protein
LAEQKRIVYRLCLIRRITNTVKRSKHRFYCKAILSAMLLAAGFGCGSHTSNTESAPVPKPAPKLKPVGPLTFNRDIAPIIFRECTGCHQPGQAAPFTLATYADVTKRKEQIVKVTSSRFMPPWLPEHGFGEFSDTRRLSDQEIAAIRQWVAEGALEGDAADAQPAPLNAAEWPLGTPDLIVKMPAAFKLPADGRDIYRNFVVPLPNTASRRVRAVEVHPDTKAVHHLFVLVDRIRGARRLDEKDAEPGFPGMALPPSVESPGGYFLSWQPGRSAIHSEPRMPWTLPSSADLVLQAHMRPTGKPENVQVSVGFYFTDITPTNAPVKLGLNSYAIDIPAGVSNYVVTDSFTLPAPMSVLGILPHAHYLGKVLEGYAELPGGGRKWLLKINDWDFNWQGAYRCKEPVRLPKGSTLVMRFAYDNSTNNIDNPHQPPIRVRYGLQSTDEMAGLVFQLLADGPADLQAFQLANQNHVLKDVLEFNTLMLERDPKNAHAHVQLAKGLLVQGKQQEAFDHLKTAVTLDPSESEGHYHLGLIAMERDQAEPAIFEFQAAIRLNPDYVKARNNLGLIFMALGRYAEAEQQFRAALATAPDDRLVGENLQLLQRTRAAKSN